MRLSAEEECQLEYELTEECVFGQNIVVEDREVEYAIKECAERCRRLAAYEG